MHEWPLHDDPLCRSLDPIDHKISKGVPSTGIFTCLKNTYISWWEVTIGGKSVLLSGKAREHYKISARNFLYFHESTENFESIRQDTVIILTFADEK